MSLRTSEISTKLTNQLIKYHVYKIYNERICIPKLYVFSVFLRRILKSSILRCSHSIFSVTKSSVLVFIEIIGGLICVGNTSFAPFLSVFWSIIHVSNLAATCIRDQPPAGSLH
jgi:hypothetical protein